MHYVKTEDLQPGFVIAQDVKIYEPVKLFLFKSRTELKEENILQLKSFNVPGLYVRDETDELHSSEPRSISDKLKHETLNNLEEVFDVTVTKTKEQFDKELVSLSSNVNSMIDNITKQKTVSVNIDNLKSHNEYTYTHCLSVAILSIAIGVGMKLPKEAIYKLGMSGLLHDIGKMAIPNTILDKPSKLDDDEFDLIKSHPSRGLEYLNKSGMVDPDICAGVVGHHERWDGFGYPDKLGGNKIPLFARIISVADIYDALTSNRPYRIPNTPAEAVEFLMGNCATMLDYDIVKLFIKCVEFYPVGSIVKLNNGLDYIVMDNTNPLRPVVSSITNPNEVHDLFVDADALKLIISSQSRD